MTNKYRTDIDGLRAIAVISVILFHLKYISNGYLGVDVFFVISGYLITSIIYQEVESNSFSILKFYERRIRRIIPLVLFTSFVAFILGLFFMLPDDLENLSQAVFASNFSVNNILMRITSSDYWAIKNDYKPLMHTWSLGIEEQFYLFYPFIFFFLKGKKSKYILIVLIILTILSLSAFVISDNISDKFYFIQYRFFELSFGGIAAIYYKNKQFKSNNKNQFLLLLLNLALIGFLFFSIIINNTIQIIGITLITTGILVFGDLQYQKNYLYKMVFSNRLITGIGKISFSIYMWHQIIFAFVRYIEMDAFSIWITIMLLIIILLLSISTYLLIENPFRNKKLWKTKHVFIVLSLFFVLITSSSFYVYLIGGVVKDVPQLGLKYEVLPKKLNFFNKSHNIQRQYNEDVRSVDKVFSKNNKFKVLVIGNSYGRDFINVLLESSFIDKIEVRYFDFDRIKTDKSIIERIKNADYIFMASDKYISRDLIINIENQYKINIINKMTVIGTKDFGYSNGIHYNNIKKTSFNYKTYRTKMKNGVLNTNIKSKLAWKTQYIDLIDLVTDGNGNVLVFTPNSKFISQDTRHFTKFGAVYFAKLLDKKLKYLLKI